MEPVITLTTPSAPYISKDTKSCALKIILIFVRTMGFLSFMVFILCLPMGDPQETCTVEVCSQDNVPTALAYSYVCSVYRTVTSVMRFTSSTMQEVSESTGCVLLDLLHEAKLKFYSLLTKIDKQDLCRTVCCLDEMDLEVEPTPQQKENKRSCKCKAKCCKRQHSQTP